MKFKLVEDLDSIIQRISKKYKPKREIKLGASYLLPSGEFIYTKDYGHKEIDDYLVEIGEYKEEEIETEEGNFVLSKENCVRLNAGIGFCFIGLPDRNLSLEQYESLEKWLELLEEKGYGRIDIFEQLKQNPQAKRYNLKEETPEEIIKKIKRYYASGKLYESKIEEKIEITNYKTSFGDKEKEFKGYGNFAYIDRDGNYINGDNNSIHNDLAWELLANNGYEDYTTTESDDSDSTIQEELGYIAIRCDSFEGNKISIQQEPSSRQWEEIEKVLDYFYETNRDEPIEVYTKTKIADYSFKDYFPNDILNKIKEYYITGRLDEDVEENDLDKEFDRIANYYLKEINKFLDNYGFEANFVDYKFENDAAGMFVGEEQDDASVFPIALNKKIIIEYGEDLSYDIESTIAHEVGHGIFRYLNDIYDLDEYNEEDIVEDFARDYSDNILDNNELMEILNYYLKDF